jgi:hypothetical protein
MSNINSQEFKAVIKGTAYLLPIYSVEDGIGLVETGGEFPLSFVRGSKLGSEQVEKHAGVLHEGLLAMMIHDLKYKNSLVPSLETEAIIAHFEAALAVFEQRARARKAAGIQGTYQK